MAQARKPGLFDHIVPPESGVRHRGILAPQLRVPGPIGLSDSATAAVLANRLKALRPAFPALPTLQAGSRGADVKKLHQLLNSRLIGAQLPLDGQFNQATRDAVLVFQKAKGIAADGVVGKMTWYQLLLSTRGGVQLPRNPKIALSIGSANSTPAIMRSAPGHNEPVWEWPLREKLVEVAKRVPSRLPDEAKREWNAITSPLGLVTALGTIAASAFLSDGAALLLGAGALGIDVIWNTSLAAVTTVRATTDEDLNKAADDLAHIVISVGATLFLVGLFKYVGKLSATDGSEISSFELDGESQGQTRTVKGSPSKITPTRAGDATQQSVQQSQELAAQSELPTTKGSTPTVTSGTNGESALSKGLEKAGFSEEISLKKDADSPGEGLRKIPTRIIDGRIRRSLTSGSLGSFKNRTIDFVLTKDGRLVVGRGHSVLSDGEGVAFAGKLKFNGDGQVTQISNFSGHYETQAGRGLTQSAKQYLKDVGVNVSKAKVVEYKP